METEAKKELTLEEQYHAFNVKYSQMAAELGDLTYRIDRMEAHAGELKIKMLNTQHEGHKLQAEINKANAAKPTEVTNA